MTREEAIKRFENVKANALVQKASGVSEYWQNEIDGTIEAIDMAIDALKQTAWIPVGERLPETGTMVLLYIPPRDGVLQQGIRIGYRDERNPIPEDEHGERNFWGMRTYGGEWHVTGWGYYEKPIPTAWMPLPEPYKGGEDND